MKTNTEIHLEGLSPEVKGAFAPAFINIHYFYATCYLIAQNEHHYGQEKPTNWEESIKVVHAYQQRIEAFLDQTGLEGGELMADIKSEYLEDYIAYRERDLEIDNNTFMQIMHNIQKGL